MAHNVGSMCVLSGMPTNCEWQRGLPRGSFLTCFGSRNLLESDENTPERNVQEPTILCTTLAGRGESSIMPGTHSKTPFQIHILQLKISDLKWILDLCKFTIWCLEFQRIQLRKRFCPSQDRRVTEAPVLDECALLCKLVPFPPPCSSLPAPHSLLTCRCRESEFQQD